MQLALITDTHHGERGDSPIFQDYQKLFYDDVFFPTLRERGINTVFHLGDLVERRKYININTAMRIWEDFLNPLQAMDCRLLVIAGNHDLYHKNNSEVNSLKLLLKGTSFGYITDPFHFTGSYGIQETILLLPWINDSNREASLRAIQNSNAKLVFGHLEIKDFAMHKGQIAQHGMDPNIFQNFEAVFSGHYHTKSSRDNIHYLGTPFQMNWGDYGEERGFHIFDTDTRRLEFIPNPYHLFNKFFYDDTGKSQSDLKAELDQSYFEQVYVKIIVEKKTDPYLFDWTLDYITSKNPLDVVVANAQEVFSRDYIPPIHDLDDTPSILKKSVQAIDIPDKIPLENLLIELYNEAQSHTA